MVMGREALPGPGNAKETWEKKGSPKASTVAQIIADQPPTLCLCFEKCPCFYYVFIYLFLLFWRVRQWKHGW